MSCYPHRADEETEARSRQDTHYIPNVPGQAQAAVGSWGPAPKPTREAPLLTAAVFPFP